MLQLAPPPPDATVRLSKKSLSRWRECTKPPTVETLASEPVLTLLTTVGGSVFRIVLIKVDAERWLRLDVDSYDAAIEGWSSAANGKTAKTVVGPALGAVLKKGVYRWWISRTFTADGLPTTKKVTKASTKKTTTRKVTKASTKKVTKASTKKVTTKKGVAKNVNMKRERPAR